ncbi:MAG: BadF/BadG/BcrA/BcrD ATPase family protein [Thermoplasmatales archaeon]
MLLSVDGGATKTIAILVDEENTTVEGVGVSGPASLISVPIDLAGQNIMKAINDALDDAHIHLSEVNNAVFGLSGMGDSKELNKNGSQLIYRLTSREDFGVVNDGLPAFTLAHLNKDGIIFAGGTGSVVYYRINGSTRRVGGWNWFVGDDGSASWIAKRALNLATLEYDDIYPEKRIVREAKKYFGMEFREAIAFLDKHQDKRIISGFAPYVSYLAISGYLPAIKILEESAEYISSILITISKKYSIKPRISLIGGTMQAGSFYTDLIFNKLKIKGSVFYGYHVAIGGIILMLLDKHDLNESVRDNLINQMNAFLRKKGKSYWGDFIMVD